MSTALAVIEPAKQSTELDAYRPRNIDQAFQIAQWFAKSGLLGELNSPEKVMLVMMTGAELDIPVTAALRGIHIIKGKPAISADLKVSLCIRRKDRCEYFHLIESDENHATYETKPVGGKPQRNTFTLADAKRANLSFAPDSNWTKYPRAMLRHRASSELATAVYPDLVHGIQTIEEMADEPAAKASAVQLETAVVMQPAAVTVPAAAPAPAASASAHAAPHAAQGGVKPPVGPEQIAEWVKVFENSWNPDEIKATSTAIASAEWEVSKSDRKILVDLWRKAADRIKKAETPPQAPAEREAGEEG